MPKEDYSKTKYQQKDGLVKIPKILQKNLDFKEIKSKN